MLKSRVLSFISEDYLISQEDISVEEEKKLGEGFLLKKFSVFWGADKICEWSETVSESSEWVIYSIDKLSFTSEKATFEYIQQICHKRLFASLVVKHRDLMMQVKEQQETIKKLSCENTHLRYSPGGEGALEAQKHFETLAETASDEKTHLTFATALFLKMTKSRRENF